LSRGKSTPAIRAINKAPPYFLINLVSVYASDFRR
jgi:hypothetical protein